MTDMLPEGRAQLRDEAAGAASRSARSFLADLGIPDEVARLHRADARRFDARDTAARAARAPGIELPPLETYATSCGTTGSARSTRTSTRTAPSRAPSTARPCVITGASSGIGRAAALKIAAAGGIPILVARTQEKLDEVKAEIEAAGGTAYVYSVRPVATSTRSTRWSRRCSPTTRGSTCSSTTPAARSGARCALSYDRFHDYERTVQLNYLCPVKLMLGAAAAHARPGRRPHRQRVLDRRADEPAALLAPTSAPRPRWTRSRAWSSSETIGDNVTFTTIHMPLVRTPMIAPTKMYDSFPTISPDEAADLVCEAIRAKPKQINTQLGHVRRGRLRARAEGRRPDPAPGLQGLPGVRRPPRARRTGDDKASGEATALAYLMRGVHW